MITEDIENLDDITKELIYDFMTVISGTIDYISEGFLHIYYENEDYNLTTHYCLRQSLRNIGYKVVEKKAYSNVVVFKTNIPDNVVDKLYTFYEEKCYSVYLDRDINSDAEFVLDENSQSPEIDDDNNSIGNNDNPEDY